MSRRALICTVLLASLTPPVVAQEAPVKVLATIAVQGAFGDIEPLLSPRAGVPVTIEFGPTALILERMAKGETADLVILTQAAVQQLAAQGQVQSQADLVQSEVGIAVAANAPTPAMKTTEDLVAFLKATPSIAYTARGASGTHIAQVIEKLGLTAVVKPKATIVQDGFSGELLRDGRVAAAVQQISELRFAGATNIVPLPEANQARQIFTAAVLSSTQHADAAAKVMRALTSADAAAAYERSGVSPLFK